MTVVVYVPADSPGRPSLGIDRGSGIVGGARAGGGGLWEEDGERVLIDYEGARFGQVNMRRWVERVWHAYGRQAASYPTSARAFVPREELVRVGEFDPETKRIVLDGAAAEQLVEEWIGKPVDATELAY